MTSCIFWHQSADDACLEFYQVPKNKPITLVRIQNYFSQIYLFCRKFSFAKAPIPCLSSTLGLTKFPEALIFSLISWIFSADGPKWTSVKSLKSLKSAFISSIDVGLEWRKSRRDAMAPIISADFALSPKNPSSKASLAKNYSSYSSFLILTFENKIHVNLFSINNYCR